MAKRIIYKSNIRLTGIRPPKTKQLTKPHAHLPPSPSHTIKQQPHQEKQHYSTYHTADDRAHVALPHMHRRGGRWHHGPGTGVEERVRVRRVVEHERLVPRAFDDDDGELVRTQGEQRGHGEEREVGLWHRANIAIRSGATSVGEVDAPQEGAVDGVL